jgi:hypothetical protein
MQRFAAQDDTVRGVRAAGEQKMRTRYGSSTPVVVVALVLSLAGLGDAQTRVTPPKNSYTPEQDVKLGLEAAAQARKELPMLGDRTLDNYVATVGRRLVAAIPPELANSRFQYTFEVVNQKEINAFALPGGPMFLNRGMIEAAKTEAEMAGVMGHEISHVVLRHGTAQATKGQKFQIGSVLGQIAGAVIGGAAGSIIAQGSQFGLGAYFLKYGREYESQADLLGAQILARAGYDPRQMANMFKTIEAEGGGRGPEWLSSHPNPGNRYNAINKEAQSLRINGNGDTGEFRSIQARLNDMSPALTAEQIARNQKNKPRSSSSSSRTAVRVEPPADTYRSYQPANFLRVSVPSNWEQDAEKSGVTYAPPGGFIRDDDGRTSFTHGVQLGVAQGGAGSLERDTDAFLQSLTSGNPRLRRQGGYRRDTVGGRDGLTASLLNVSDVTGRDEEITLSTARLRDGSLLFVIGVAPEEEQDNYDRVFRRVRQSIQLADR